MHQTKTGRWVPDKPSEPEPEPRFDLSYDSYQFHAYAHPVGGLPGCGWCYFEEHPPKLTDSPPWDVLAQAEMR